VRTVRDSVFNHLFLFPQASQQPGGDGTVMDPATVVRILRKNFSAHARKRILDFPAATFEVELNDGSIAYWPTSQANQLDVSLHKQFKKAKKKAQHAIHNSISHPISHPISNPISNAARTSASINVARTDARFAARHVDTFSARHVDSAAYLAALVELEDQIWFDKANFPSSLLIPVEEDVEGKSSLKGDIEAACARRYLELTSHEALSKASCSTCWEAHLQSGMEHIDCTDLEATKELFRPLMEWGRWPEVAKKDFKFSSPFTGLDGTLYPVLCWGF
jgi:hypothetical protein